MRTSEVFAGLQLRRDLTFCRPATKGASNNNFASLKFMHLLYILLHFVHFCSPARPVEKFCPTVVCFLVVALTFL